MITQFKTLFIAAFVVVTAAGFTTGALASADISAALPDLDVPFIVSPPAVANTMLAMADVTAADFVIDLGSGDGRIIVLAAKTFGARGLGVDIDPKLVATARNNAERAKVTDRASFRVEDLFTTDLSKASVITMYLLPDVNLALRPKLLKLKPGTRIVSHDWDMGDWPHDQMRVVDNPEKTVGREKTSKIFLWVVPANINGKWCAIDTGEPNEPPMAVTLDLDQQYQTIHGVLIAATAQQKKPMRLQFRTTVRGDKFVIADATSDAEAKIYANHISLDGTTYGLSRTLQFRRAAQCVLPVGSTVARR